MHFANILSMDGMEAFAKTVELCHNNNRIKMPKYVAVTANVQSDVRTKCLSMGMSGFLSKPIRVKDLEEEIQRLFVVE